MFVNFLIGTLLLSALVLVVLLVQPRPGDDVRTDRLPFVGIALAGLMAVLAFVGGLVVSA